MSQNETNPAYALDDMTTAHLADMRVHRLIDTAACALDALKGCDRIYQHDEEAVLALAATLHARAAQIVRTWD